MTRLSLYRAALLSLLAILLASGVLLAADKVSVNTSTAADGYISVKYIGKKSPAPRMKVVLQHGGEEYKYDLNRNSEADNFPLQLGNGDYNIQVYEHVVGTKYAMVHSQSFTALLKNELSPFLISTQFINYSAESQAVKKSIELVAGSDDAVAKIGEVYSFVINNISYDYDKASGVISGTITAPYIPSVDDTLSSQKGICFDYSSLFAAMLRAQGVPTRLVMGYVAPDNVYHAWNEVYLEGQGWVELAKLNFPGKAWERMDSTFAASGGNSTEVITRINNDDAYQTRYIY